MTIIEKDISEQVEFDRRVPYDIEPDLVDANPLCKVPTLVLDNGHSLFDSKVICEYLDSLNDTPRLLPISGDERWHVLRLVALADGMTDAAYNARMESVRPRGKKSTEAIEGQRDKIRRGISALETSKLPDPNKPDLGMIALAATLGYVDLRHPDLEWRKGHTELQAWMQKVSERTSFRETIPIE